MNIWIPFLSPWLKGRHEEKIQRVKREAEKERRRQHKAFLAEQKRLRKALEFERAREAKRKWLLETRDSATRKTPEAPDSFFVDVDKMGTKPDEWKPHGGWADDI